MTHFDKSDYKNFPFPQTEQWDSSEQVVQSVGQKKQYLLFGSAVLDKDPVSSVQSIKQEVLSDFKNFPSEHCWH